MLIEKTNSFYPASMPTHDGHISKIRLMEELARQNGTQYDEIFAYHNGCLFILLNEDNRFMRVRYDDILICSNNPHDPESERMTLFDGEWFEEVEKYREMIERNMKAIQWKQRTVFIQDGNYAS